MTGTENDPSRFYNEGTTQIGVQGGKVEGDVRISNSYNYTLHGTKLAISPGDPPQKKLDDGIECLASGRRAEAQKLIHEAILGGCAESRSFYYLMLSVLSKRLFEQLDPGDIEMLIWAQNHLSGKSDDRFYTAARVVTNMIKFHRTEDQDEGSLQALQDEFERLPEDLRSEIRKHLGMIWHRVLSSRAEAEEAREVRDNRKNWDREERAWMFFLPDPEPPRRRRTVPPRSGFFRLTGLASSAALALFGAVWCVFLLMSSSSGSGILVALLWVFGGYATAVLEPKRAWLRKRHLRKRFENSPYSSRSADADDPRRLVLWEAFYSAANSWFAEQLMNGESPVAWRTARLGQQVTLANDLLDRYGDFGDTAEAPRRTFLQVIEGVQRLIHGSKQVLTEGETARLARFEEFEKSQGSRDHPSNPTDYEYRVASRNQSPAMQKLGWLFDLHARNAAERWRSNTMETELRRIRLPKKLMITLIAGAVACSLGAVIALTRLIAPDFLDLAMIGILIGGGGWSAWRVWCPLVIRRLDYKADVEYFEHQFNEEKKAFNEWCSFLKDRPADLEMARWLDYDQRALRLAALDVSGLNASDVIFDFFLLEAAEGCVRARELYCPPRYSAYNILLFMLTETDVRHFRWSLNFLTGNEGIAMSRRIFQYDNIVEAKVEQIAFNLHEGSRTQGKTKTIINLPSGRFQPTDTGMGQLIVSQELVLSLTNQGEIVVSIENYDNFRDQHENIEKLIALAHESSGAHVGLRVLEAVTGAGKAWFEQERRRQDRQLRDSYQVHPPNASNEIGSERSRRGIEGPPGRHAR
jgi:hypothetical protein